MVCDDRNWLLQQGFSVTSFAYPYSNFGNGAATAVAECGYTNARAGWQLRPDAPATCVTNEQLLGDDPARRRVRHPHHGAGRCGDDAGRPADDGERTPGRDGWVPILFHDICPPSPECGPQGISPTVFQPVRDLAGRAQGGERGDGADGAPGHELGARRGRRCRRRRRPRTPRATCCSTPASRSRAPAPPTRS